VARIGTNGDGRRPGGAWRLALAIAALVLVVLGQASPAGARIADGARPLAESPPKVTQQPQSKTVSVGQSASFTATASEATSEQWEVSTDAGKTFQPIEGATGITYTVTNATSAMNGNQYRAVFKNGAGTTASSAATLTVNSPPVVTQQPSDAFTAEGQEATFESKASGQPAPTVQWQLSTDGGSTYKNVSGATSTTLHLAHVAKSQNNQKYRAVFKNASGTTNSEPATLHILEPPTVGQQPLDKKVTEGETATFTSSATGNPAPTVQWEVSTDGGMTFTAIEGATSGTLTIPNTTPSEDGYRYRAVWTNAAGTTTSSVAKLTVVGVPLVTEQPESTVVIVGGTATFEAEGVGHPDPTVQWEVSTNGGTSYSPIEGATSDTLTIAGALLTQNGNLYRAVFKNIAGSATSEAALLTVSTTDYRGYGWGANKNGQAGTGASEGTVPSPGPTPGLGFVTQMAAGFKHSLALRAGGSVESWGSNAHGQLGNEGAVGVRTPMLIEHLTGVKEVAAGGMHSLALLSNGTVDAWGSNEFGQLGTGSKPAETEVPVPVPGLTGVIAIAAGEDHSLALLSNGTVMAWGENEEGQLGNGNTNQSNTPVEVKGLTGVTAIAAGGQFSMALLNDGTVVAWGSDTHGQLGNAENYLEEEVGEEQSIHSENPVPVDGLTNVKAIEAGKTHALALLNDGTVDSWGDDTAGELGNGAIEPLSFKATPIPGLTGVTAISAGERLSAAVLSTGKVMTWGTNADGGLGTGAAGEPSDVPVQAQNISQVVGISVGGGQMIAFGEAGPTVSKVSPHEGAMAGGTSVTITGANFGGASAVHFGAAAATSFKVESSSTITATAPAGSGTVDVTVTTASGTSAPGIADRFTYRTPPTLTKLSVKGGPATGGTAVTITGTELAGATSVSFGGAAAPSFTVVSPTTINAVTPPGAAGYQFVTVTTVGGTSATTTKARFKYAPVIESISPANGPLAGGNTVTITGVGFVPGTGTVKFKFGKGSSKSVQCSSTTSCTVLVPVGKATGTVDVIATAAKAKSTAAEGDHYTYE
jgi:alpha-tubulin suppressor-like RCC1 family protein